MIYSKKAICVALACCCLSGTAFAQHVSLTMNNVTVKQAMDALKKQSGYSFVFSSEDVDTKKKVSVDADDQKVEDVVRQILDGQSVTYEIKGKNIVVRSIAQTSSSQQKKTITGTIVDPSGMPVIGANVMVKGTTNGTITDMDGKFSLEVPEGATLLISYIGYNDYEALATENIKIKLTEDATQLDEVVAIGYGVKKKSTLTGSISMVDKEVLEDRPVSKTTDLLQGTAPGLQITRSNQGKVRGSNSSMSIRGTTSRSDPGVLIVIDGIAQKDNGTYALDNINPDDIENISILKDAQASIYGARAAGGVILVTTKKGLTDKPTINFSGTYTIQKPSLFKERTNVLQLVEMMNEGFVNDGQETNMYSHIVKYIADNHLTMEEISKNNGKYSCQWPFDNSANFVFGDYDWADIMFDPAPMQNYNLSVSGKTKRFN